MPVTLKHNKRTIHCTDESPIGEEVIIVPGHIVKYVYREGFGHNPIKYDTVIAYSRCFRIDGQEFTAGKHITGSLAYFDIGFGRLIRGLEEGLKMVKANERCRMVISPEYAYGTRIDLPTIPPNTKLVFEFDIMQIYHNLQCENLHQEEYENDVLLLLKMNVDKADEMIKRQQYKKACTYMEKAHRISHMSKTAKEKLYTQIVVKWSKMCEKMGDMGKAKEILNMIPRQKDDKRMTIIRAKVELYRKIGILESLEKELELYFYKYFYERPEHRRFFIEYLKEIGSLRYKNLDGYDHRRKKFIDLSAIGHKMKDAF